MTFYNTIVPFELAVKLKEAGLNQSIGHHWFDPQTRRLIDTLPDADSIVAPTIGDAMDWLMEKGIFIYINAFPCDSSNIGRHTEFEGFVVDVRVMYSGESIRQKVEKYAYAPDYHSWCGCADDCIDKALEVLRNEKGEKDSDEGAA